MSTQLWNYHQFENLFYFYAFICWILYPLVCEMHYLIIRLVWEFYDICGTNMSVKWFFSIIKIYIMKSELMWILENIIYFHVFAALNFKNIIHSHITTKLKSYGIFINMGIHYFSTLWDCITKDKKIISIKFLLEHINSKL